MGETHGFECDVCVGRCPRIMNCNRNFNASAIETNITWDYKSLRIVGWIANPNQPGCEIVLKDINSKKGQGKASPAPEKVAQKFLVNQKTSWTYWKKILIPFVAPKGSRYGALPTSGKGQGDAENPF